MPRILRLLVWPMACFAAAFAISLTGPARQLELRTLDWRTQLRTLYQGPPDPRVVLVLYEDNTDAAIPWPPERNVHGALIELMSKEHPKVITFDVMLDFMREGDGDRKMADGVEAAAKEGATLVTAATTGPDPEFPADGKEGPTRPITNLVGDISKLEGDEQASIRPFPDLRAVSLYGFADTPPDAGGMRREIPLLVRAGNRVFPSLSLQTLMAYYGVGADAVNVVLGDRIDLGGKMQIPISRKGTYFLNYRYDFNYVGKFDFPTYSYITVLLQLDEKRVKGNTAAGVPDLRDKVVFVGQIVTGKADAGPTPLNPLAPLVLIHANVVNNVLARDFAHVAPDWLAWGAALALGAATLLTLRRSIWFMGVIAILVAALYFAVTFAAWINWSLWIPLTGPLVGFVASEFVLITRRAISEKKGRDQVKLMFGSYLSPELVDRLVKSGKMPHLGGHDAEITAYFSDIQGFSTFSEKLPPDRLVDLMNEYLTVCTDIVQAEGGTLDKYIGDAVVAIFGAPIAQQDHAYRACVASLRVQEAIAGLRKKWRTETMAVTTTPWVPRLGGQSGSQAVGQSDSKSASSWPDVVVNMRARIGLNTGTCIVGNMGSRRRFSYTMMGDDVNLAARMESGAKSWGVYTMCAEATKTACVTHGGDRVVFRALGRIVVMGRSTAVPIHEIVGLRESVPTSTLECVEAFEAGLNRYFDRDWAGAIGQFERSSGLEPNQPGRDPGVKTNPSVIYIQLSRDFQAKPPPEEWDGTYVMSEK